MSPNEESLHNPYLMHDMNKAVKRIREAVENNEKITVYGDYDADGVTSTTILLETLELLGVNANFYIPNRFTDGYGPNTEAFNRIISDGTTLILTCDNGISGYDAIQAAVNKGVDVIVTDHHELPSILPAAYAIVHPRHPEGHYPFGELSGAGVAFKLAEALLEEIPEKFYDLVAIGTVADVVSLTDENRFLVMKGLEALKTTNRIGLQVLLKNSDVIKKEMNEETIGFKIGPRLNALGRLGDASPAVRLLSTLDYNEAENIAQFIDEKNEERKDCVSHITEEAIEQIKMMTTKQEVYVVAKENWHEGVLGIVASKLVEITEKPVIVLTVNKETGLAKGSGRSISSVNLYKLLDAVSSLIDTFGGHHMAAGLSIQAENVELLRQSLNDSVLKKLLPKKEEASTIDGEVRPEECTIEMVKEIQQLAPFGTDNPFPLFMLKNTKAKQIRKIGADANHLKLSLDYGDKVLDTIGFGFGPYGDWLKSGTKLSLVGKLGINEWHGTKKVQLIIKDLEATERQFFDYRKTRITGNIWELPETDYLFFNPAIESEFKSSIPKDGTIHLIDRIENLNFLKTKEIDRLVIVDCPPTLELLKFVLDK
ncbi:MAG: single-stranded-DNA-specific exonuclease RecJ, partial [Pisciglobus halotolerans]|nr:single-stranded-DNA-specific exonuclease RecJ [Pisciglobus halotolerans]